MPIGLKGITGYDILILGRALMDLGIIKQFSNASQDFIVCDDNLPPQWDGILGRDFWK